MPGKVQYRTEFRKEANLFLVLFMGVWLVACLALAGFLCFALIGDAGRNNELWIVVLLVLLAAVVVLDRILWHLRGREQVEINGDTITVSKRGCIFTSAFRLSLDEIEAVYADSDPGTTYMTHLYGLGGGRIVLEYLGRKKRIGQDVPYSLAEIVAKEIASVKETGKVN